MKTYRYRGFRENGEPVEGTLEAANEAAATEKARQQCKVLTKVAPDTASSLREILNTDISHLLSGGKIPAKQLSVLCSQLAIGLRAGMPLVRCLLLTAKNQKDPHIRQLLEGSAEAVSSGMTLAEALEDQDAGLPPVFLQTIRAGEASGTLADSFRRLSDHYAGQAAVASAVSSAMIYPAMLITVAIGVILVILVFAVPVFQESFARMGEALPLPTAILVNLSGFLTRHGFLLTAVLVLLGISLGMYVRSHQGSLILARLRLTLPVIGEITRMHAAAQLSATLAAMLRAGIPLLSALNITADAMDNPLLADALRRAELRLREGALLSQSLEECPFLPNLLTELTAVGEQTASLEDTLELAAEYYRREVDTSLKRALGILEPCIILVLAMLVVFILLAVYLPVFGMYGTP